MSYENRQWILRNRPVGDLADDCLELVTSPAPAIDDGEALIRLTHLSIDPTIRGWMSHDTYLPAIPIGDVVRSAAAGTVVESRSDDYPVGATVMGLFGWQDYAVVGPDGMGQVIPEGIEITDAMSLYGSTGVTAYIGLTEIGRPEAGETVVVSGAAGATGSIAGQVAKILGCRVIGIAGTDEKCRWLEDDLGFDATINYRTDDVSARIGELCPEGLDVFYDNVGGPILEAALDHLALRARIVLCGAISTYNDADDSPTPGPRNLFNLITQRARMEGFIMLDYIDRFPEAAFQLGIWGAEGLIKHKVFAVDGLEQAPEALRMLFSGANDGKVIVTVEDN